MEISAEALTTCEVAADGGVVSLGLVDSEGKPATIRLSLTQVGALVMTLPGLIEKALQARYGDQSLRYPGFLYSRVKTTIFGNFETERRVGSMCGSQESRVV